MDRRELADFLRRSRERLKPSDVGLTDDGRRRTPGLRREEVAMLAAMSADYYMRLEQARGPQPSTQVLAPLSRALRLSEDERDHLYLLAGHRPPAGRQAGDRVRPGLLFLLDRLVDTPAQILTDIGDLLEQNSLAEALFGGVCPTRQEDRNIVWRWFTDPAHREEYPPEDRDHWSRVHAADLRAAAARRGDDPVVSDLVRRLRQVSTEFDELWRRHEVGVRRTGRLRLKHPSVGMIDLECEQLLSPAEDQHLMLYTAQPGSRNFEQLRLLRVLGGERFVRAAGPDQPGGSVAAVHGQAVAWLGGMG
ncbi:transcriptional regulator with XRE-family HTH domain [Actinoplanes campanulatus]|uniref:Transcriptional regulator with XRE-family HTH domain n=1 Tax=Actinoplanes campanulatus TaxID=113559 RepID=A0A7W5AR23_9ACTN|nr:helix-turn-helix transcriptional regulator [Actinoplanes campanulatus]MBB3100776.1 transcriptional regulator with XRE-family HTH domain [Actinoplanes campanulatus]GGN46672.1 XRE family transcriptional regulator [Actinoplanes campanulatus]GID41313.1 XRE family transcriptional regulator [Actinoplanes campanulatus]